VPERLEEFNTYHTFVVRVGARDDVRHYMQKRGIETNIHYPKPIHRQPAFNKLFEDVKLPRVEEQANEILSIPVHQYLTDTQVEHVASTLKEAVNRIRPGANVG
jgi:dTDP-4-amino-4,6-dideoxygalactose transaminase